MAKTKEELNAIKEEYITLSRKLQELSEDELQQVIGGNVISQSIEPKVINNYKLNNDVDLNNPWSPPTNNIDGNLTGDFKGNWTNSNGGGVFNEGEL